MFYKTNVQSFIYSILFVDFIGILATNIVALVSLFKYFAIIIVL